MRTKMGSKENILQENKCSVCGNMYRRTYCDYCKRIERWNPNKIINTFSPRIQKNLKKIKIEIPRKELLSVRNAKGLFLTGKSGCGKTLYSAAFLVASSKERMIQQAGPRTHLLISMPDMLEEIKKSFDHPTKVEPVEFYSKVDLLVLDDLGAEKLTDWSLEKLYQIINYRYEYLLPTIFTSNLSLGELANQIGDRIPSRIEEMCVIKRMKEIDYRLEK